MTAATSNIDSRCCWQLLARFVRATSSQTLQALFFLWMAVHMLHAQGCIPGAQDPGLMDCHTTLVPDVAGSLGSLKPLVLIHGINGNQWPPNGPDSASDPYPDYFRTLITYLTSRSDFNSTYKIYRFQYESNEQSVLEIARSLRNWIDWFTKNDPAWNQQIIIVAHSMGGLVARSYMNEYDTDYDTGNGQRFAGLKGGERVSTLVTLATPHHGTPTANDVPRTDGIFSAGEWLTLMEGFDEFFWNRFTNPSQPNRADLRWDNYNGVWNNIPSLYNADNALEYNSWLIQIPHTYDGKLTAFYGYIGSNDLVTLFGSYNEWGYLDIAAGWYFDNFPFGQFPMEGPAVLLQRIMTPDFNDSDQIAFVNNDGVVPDVSGEFVGWGVKRIGCQGANHTDMRTGTIGALCDNGLTLFSGIAVELGLPATYSSPPVIAVSPDNTWNYGTVTVGTALNQTFTIANNGASTLTVSSLGLSGSSDFLMTNAPAVPFSVQTNTSQQIVVTFHPCPKQVLAV